jgi:hypothetical protein
MTAVKPGIKTTEFYISAIAAILAQIVALGWLPAAASAYVTTNIQALAQLVVAIIVVGYNLSRAVAKHGATTTAVVDTSALEAAELKLNMPPEWVSAMPRLVAFLDMVAQAKQTAEPVTESEPEPEMAAEPSWVPAPEPAASPPPAEHAAPVVEPDAADPDEDVPPL